MPGITVKGISYMLAADPLAQVAAQMANLATSIEAFIPFGYRGGQQVPASAASLVTGTPYLQTVNLPAVMPTINYRISLALSSSSPQNFDIGFANKTTSSFDIVVCRRAGSATNVGVEWVAAYQ